MANSMKLDYLDNDSYQCKIKLTTTENDIYSLIAQELRRTPSGMYAEVCTLLNNQILATDEFKLSDDKDRTHLSRATFSRLGKLVQQVYPLDNLRHDIDLFCLAVRQAYRNRFEVEYTKGETTSKPIFYLQPYLSQGTGILGFGKPGSGKSYLWLLMAQSIYSGINKYWQVSQGNVLFVNLERSKQSLQWRLAMVNKVLGLPEDTELPMLNARGASLRDVRTIIRRHVQETIECKIFLDSMSRGGFGSMIEDQNANSLMDELNMIAPYGWAAIGHENRKGEDHVFGSIFFDAAADMAIHIQSERQENKLGLSLDVVKQNDGTPPKKSYWALKFDGDNLIGFESAKSTDFPQLLLAEKHSPLDRIITYLQEVGSASASEIAKEIDYPQPHISTLLKNDKFFIQLDKRKTPSGQWEVPYGLKAIRDV